jgi:hypothetical protein
MGEARLCIPISRKLTAAHVPQGATSLIPTKMLFQTAQSTKITYLHVPYHTFFKTTRTANFIFILDLKHQPSQAILNSSANMFYIKVFILNI